MSEYAQSSTYVIVSFYRSRRDLEKIVDQVWYIRERCAMVCFHRGDLTGIAYGMGYTGLDDAAKLLADFERQLSDLKERIAELKKALPAPDFECITEYEMFFDGERKRIQLDYEEIRKYFNLTHENYQQYPAPQNKTVSKFQYFIHLAAYASLAYSIYHFFA